MQRPGGEAPPQFRHGPPLPPGPGPRPGMMNMGRPYAPPPIHGGGPIVQPRPPFSHQQNPRFGPPQPPMLPPMNVVLPPTGHQMPAAPPPNIGQPPPGPMPSRLPPGPPAAGPQMPVVSPRGPAFPPGKQSLPPPPFNLPQPPIACAPHSSAPTPAVPAQVSQGSLPSLSLLSQPARPNDEDVLRNIEVLVQFVLKNGPEFENMARAKQAGNPKFSFLFGGEPGSDAAMGQDYYQWLKRKAQFDQSLGREGEAKAQLAVPAGSPDSNEQHRDSKVVSLGGPSTVSVVSDMEVDMDMEDDSVVPMLVTEVVKNFQAFGRKEEELLSSVDTQQGDHRETHSTQAESLAAEGGIRIEASESESQKEKGKCLEPAFEVPCVEDVCPVQSLPKQLHHSLTMDKLEAKSFPTLKIDPPIASSGLAESEAMETSAVDVRSETVKLDDNNSGESLVRDDMQNQKLEAITPCNLAKILNKSLYSQKNRDRLVSSNNSIPLEPDTVKSNVALETDSGKPDITLAPDNLKSEMCLHGKPKGELEKVDKYGRIMRRANSDSESDGVPHAAKARRDPSWSRSPSPGYDRWRKKSYSRSPRRKSRWSSRSRSRSPKRRRSRSRTPLHDSRWGGDPRYDRLSRGRGMPPPCNDFAKGRCYRGASCKFLHQDITGDSAGRWSGGVRVKGRLDNRQDMTKSVGSKDNFLSGELEKPKSISPERFFDGHDNRSFGERQNQEFYRQNDVTPAPCFNFSKGRCYRGSSCRYLHSVTTTDPGGRWDGSGKGRERLDNREDFTKSFGGRDSFRVGELEREENISPHRLRDDHYRHNFRERRSQEADRPHGRSVPACIFFARGKCQKGLSCRFFHEDTYGQNVGGRGRERPNSRADLAESFGDDRISGVVEMDRTTNIRNERTSDGQDRWDPLTHKTQEAYIHNDSSANTVIRPQFSSPGREKSQPQREELRACSMPTADAPYLHDHRENVEHQFMPLKKLQTNSASWENVDAQPFPQDGSSAESTKAKIKPDNPVIDLCLQASEKKDSKFQTEQAHSNEGLHLTPLQPLPRDLPSQQHHAVMGFSLSSGQPLGSGGSSLSLHDTMRGMSSQHLKVESSIDPLPPGYPINSSYVYPHSGITVFSTPYQHSCIATKPTLAPQPPLEHGKFVQEVEHGAHVPIENASYVYPPSGIPGCSMPHQHSSLATKPILALQPPLEHGKFVQEVDHGTHVPIDTPTTSVVQMPMYPQTSLEPVLPHVSSTGQEVFMPKPTTMPPLASENKSGQIASAPFVLFGEQISSLFSRGVVPLSLGLSAVNHPPKDITSGGDQHNPVSDTIDNSSEARDFLNKVPESAKVHDVKGAVLEPDKNPLLESVNLLNMDSHAKPSSPSKVQDIAGNEKHKNGTESAMVETESHQAVIKDMHAGINVSENGSPAHEGKTWSPGATEIDTEQAHAQDESRKSKEIRMIKQFRSVLAEFVKEELKPTWREGHMSKEAFKTIVKKVVDKVAGSFQIHQIPKTQERIDLYLAASRPKLTKLVQGYVDKYVKS